MKKIIQLKLKYWARFILLKYKPEIIGITGSVGKTSTKEAIYTVLAKEKNVRASDKNYNNEFGLPLTIIGVESPGKNILGWFAIGFKVLKMLIIRDKNYPEILVLEMGIDRPGDMDYLNSIVKCRIGVATAVSSVHLEYFRDKDALQKEKSKLISAVIKDGWSILNYDDKETRKMMDVSKARVISYGFDKQAKIQASDLILFYDNENSKLEGIKFSLSYDGVNVPVYIAGALGSGMVYSAMAAAAVGIGYGMSLIEVSKALENYKSPKGRLNIIPGIKHTTIIDDTYNSEPRSAILAIETLNEILLKNKQRRLIALGDMLELGSTSEESHRNLGKLIADYKIDKLFVVGERARDIARGAKISGMREEDVFMFDDSASAGKFIQKRIKQGDYLLIKGSQGIRMEKIVLELMADPLRAKELLVRQEKEWLK